MSITPADDGESSSPSISIETQEPGARLSGSEDEYRAIFEASSDGLIINDFETGIVIEANPAACRMHGYDDMTGMHPSAFIHSDSHHLFDEYVQTVRQGREFRCHARDIRKDGSTFDVEVSGRRFIYRGKPALLGVVRDATDQMRAYQHLEERVAARTREIERRRDVAEGLRDLLAVVNSHRTLDSILDYVVAQSRRILGSDASAIFLPVAEEDGQNLLRIRAATGLEDKFTHVGLPAGMSSTGLAFMLRRPVVVPDIRSALPPVNGPVQQLQIRDEKTFIRVTQLPSTIDEDAYQAGEIGGTRDFATQYSALLAVPLAVKDERYGTLSLYYRQSREFTTDEIALASAFADQTALALENARLREQAEQAAVLEERQRLARDLHDAVTQTLFSASLIANVIPELWVTNPDEARRRLDQLCNLTRGALAEMRLLLVELRPGTLTDLSLADLLRQLADATTGSSGIPVSVQVDGSTSMRFPPDVQIALYRTVQEALNNVVKHAEAGSVTISLSSSLEDGVLLEIRDDGRGFDPTVTTPGHLGLSIMQERVARAGARIQIESMADKGTTIQIHWRNRERPENE